MPVQIGDTAPDFSLYDHSKKKITLSGLRGSKVLLLFFPLAFTSTCTRELCSVRDNISFYNDADATVLGISVDSLYSLARYREDQDLNFSLLSDFNKDVSQKYDCLYPLFGFEMRGVGKRAAFIIGRDGRVCYAEVLENADGIPDFDAIRETLKSLP